MKYEVLSKGSKDVWLPSQVVLFKYSRSFEYDLTDYHSQERGKHLLPSPWSRVCSGQEPPVKGRTETPRRAANNKVPLRHVCIGETHVTHFHTCLILLV
jgi:hypothetical protein